MRKNNFWLNTCGALVLLGNVGLVSANTNKGDAHKVHFNYSGDNGPVNWGQLTPQWNECSDASAGARQSPVNINRVKTDKSLKPLALTLAPTSINIINNGHTIEQKYDDGTEYEGSSSSIYFEGAEYDLQQFHFHTLSEHAINKKRGAIELHAVFTETTLQKHLVVGVLYGLGQKDNPFIQTLIDAGLPTKSGESIETETSINLADGLTNTAAYYTYAGSLTTPPCTGNVTWVVLKEVAKLSHQQWESFRTILGNNFRPLQALNGRSIRATAK